MGLFNKWLEKRNITEAAGNDFFNALTTLQKAMQDGKVVGGYPGGASVLARVAGLSPEQAQILQQQNIITRGADGAEVNPQRLQMFLSQIPGQSPTPRIAPQPQRMVPPPPGMARPV